MSTGNAVGIRMNRKNFLIIVALAVILALVSCSNEVKELPYTVTFDSDGGSTVSSQMVDEGKYVTKPTDPTKSGCNFRGWFKSDGSLFSFETETITKSITLKAKWSDSTEYCTVFFNSCGGSSVNEQKIQKGGKVAKPSNPSYEGFVFDGWVNEEYKSFDFENTAVTSDITLYADWSVKTCKVTFDSKGGSAVDAEIIVSGGKAQKPQDPILTGADFGGWITSDYKFYDFDKAVNSDITLTAVWTERYDTYTVTFESNGGTAVSPQTVKKWSKVVKPQDPVKSGYYFVNWVNSTDNNVFNFDNATVTNNITLKAVWDDKTQYFTVNFNTDGGSYVRPQRLKKGEKVVKPNSPTKNGYDFVCWTDDRGETYSFDNKTVDDNLTLTAKWTLKYYRVGFEINGGTSMSVNEEKVSPGGKAYKPANPTINEKYKTFNYWTLDGTNEYDFSTPVNKDIQLKALWRDYRVGDIGPDGGYIFYDCDEDNDKGNSDGLKSSECGWRYLEAAKSDLKDPIEWGCFSSDNYQTKYNIGSGYKNTELLLVNRNRQYPPSSDYVWKKDIDGKTDWYIPSKDELNLMYVNLHKKGLGSFRNDKYWSSSEYYKDGTHQKFEAWCQNFKDGSQSGEKRNNYCYIRPVRQF